MINIGALLFVIVNRGRANAVLQKAREWGATEATIFLGKGTVQSRVLEMLGLVETHKEILMIPSSNRQCAQLHKMLGKEFMLRKRNKGIAFSIPYKRWRLQTARQEEKWTPKDVNASYFCIMTIVDKGQGNACVKAARAAGAKGGTLIHGRGAGIPTDLYFALVIEPQKDIVMIISTKDKAAKIRERIFSNLELEKTGNGIIFTLPVHRVNGLYENRSKEGKVVKS